MLAKHVKSFSLIDRIAVGVDRIFEGAVDSDFAARIWVEPALFALSFRSTGTTP